MKFAHKRIWIVCAAVLLAVMMVAGTAYAGEAPSETPTETPAESPTQAPTETPAPTPTPTPTQAPTQAPTPTPAGTVDLTVIGYAEDGSLAVGYTFTVDETTQKFGDSGKVTFPGLTVETHKITMTAPDGKQSLGTLYMSRGDKTAITDKAMGGKYGLDIARDADAVYLSAQYAPEGAINIEGVSETPVEPTTSPSPSGSAGGDTGSVDMGKRTSAVFLDESGKPISGLKVVVGMAGTTQSLSKTTDSKGRVSESAVMYMATEWQPSLDGLDFEQMSITFQRGLQNGIVSSDTGNNAYTVSVSTKADNKGINLNFEQQGGKFVLASVGEAEAGGMSALVLVLIVAIIVVVVILVIVSVRNSQKKKNGPRPRTANGAEPRQQPRATGGRNKFDDRSRM